MKALLKIYIFTIFLLNGFSPVAILSFNFFLALLIAPFVFFSKNRYYRHNYKSDIIIIVCFLYGIFAWIFYPVPISLNRFQGVAQWMVSIFLLFFVVRKWIFVSNITFAEVSRVSLFSVIILSFFVILEFGLANSNGTYLSDIFPFSINEFPVATVFGEAFNRPRGFSAEAGFTAMAFECLVPLALFQLKNDRNRGKYFIIVWPILLAYFLLFSIASIIAVISSIGVYYLLKQKNPLLLAIKILLGFIALQFLINNQSFLDIFGYKVAAFFDPLNYIMAEGSRQEAYKAAIEILEENYLGIGWGTVLQESQIPGTEIDLKIFGSGLISLWLEVLVSLGILVGLGFISVFLIIMRKLVMDAGSASSYCYFSLSILFFHHFAVYELWFPMLWFSLALSQVVLAKGVEIGSGPGDKNVSPRARRSITSLS